MAAPSFSPWQLLARWLAALAVFAAVLFLPAGTLDWPEAWALLAVYVGYVAYIGPWLYAHNRTLLNERANWERKEGKGWDAGVRLAFFLLFVATYALAALDAKRYRWTSVPREAQLAGFGLTVLGFGLVFWVMKVNATLWRVVSVKKGQTVITTGPYALVRHPMYLGAITAYAASVLLLGSLAALLPLAVMALVLLYRTQREDDTLHRELAGYRAYAKRVRYKLVPFIW